MESHGGDIVTKAASGVSEQSARSLRFTLELTPSSDRDFPEFSYAELVQQVSTKSESRRRKATEEPCRNEATTSTFPDEDPQQEQKEVERIARGLEKKYGQPRMVGKRTVHEEDYVDVAGGYDETDPFVDNSEAVSGTPFEDSVVSRFSWLYCQHDDFLPHDFEPQFTRFYVNCGELLFKEATESGKADSQTSDGDFKSSKGSKLFKLKPPKTRRTKDGKFEPRKRKVQRDDGKVKQAKTSEKKEESSQETATTSGNQRMDQTSSHVTHPNVEAAEIKVKSSPQLPADLPADLRNMILTWKETVEHENATTKPPKTLQTSHNQKLLDVGRRIMVLKPKKYHVLVYEYLTSFLPATKETLQRRLKMMLKSEHDELIKEPLDKLKRAIDNVMSEQLSRYTEKKQAIAAEDVLVIDDDNSDEDNGSDKVKRVGPLKRFIWTETVRGLACDVVRAKVRALREINRKMIDPQSQMKAFLRDEVKVLWPQGWMNSRVLYLETKSAHESLTQMRPKKSTIQTVVKKKETGDTSLSQSTAKVFFPTPSVVSTVASSSPSSQSIVLQSGCSPQLPATPPQILSGIAPVRQLSPASLQTTAGGHSSVLSQHSYSQPASAARAPLSLQIRNAGSVRPLQTITSSVPLNQLLSMINQGHIRGQVQFIQPSSLPRIASTTTGLNLPDSSKNDKT